MASRVAAVRAEPKARRAHMEMQWKQSANLRTEGEASAYGNAVEATANLRPEGEASAHGNALEAIANLRTEAEAGGYENENAVESTADMPLQCKQPLTPFYRSHP